MDDFPALGEWVKYRFTLRRDAELEFTLFENKEIVLPGLLIEGRKLGGR